jgi:hypothetical protein
MVAEAPCRPECESSAPTATWRFKKNGVRLEKIGQPRGGLIAAFPGREIAGDPLGGGAMVDRSTVITPPGDTAWVYDPQHNEIDFVSKANASLYTYSLGQGAFTRTLAIGGTPSSIAISPDGQELVIGNASTVSIAGAANLAITRVNLSTSMVDQVLTPAGSATGVLHIGVDAKGAAFFDDVTASPTSTYWTFPAAAAAPTVQHDAALDWLTGDAFISSPDHRYVLFGETKFAPAAEELYDAVSGGVVAKSAPVAAFAPHGAVANSGLSIDTMLRVYDQQLHFVKDMGAWPGGAPPSARTPGTCSCGTLRSRWCAHSTPRPGPTSGPSRAASAPICERRRHRGCSSSTTAPCWR